MTKTTFAKVRRQTLAEQVAEGVLGYIVSAGLRPGDLLPPEAQLAEEFGVSRPVIREAMKSLEGKGVTETITGRGAVIRSTDGEQLRFFFERAVHLEDKTVTELMEVRKGLETQAAVLAAERRSGEDVAKLTEIVEKMRANLGNPIAYADLDVEFHLGVASAAGNTMLYFLIGSIREALRQAILEGLRAMDTPPQRQLTREVHEDILATIQKGKAEPARLAMARHFDEAVTAIVANRPSRVAQGPVTMPKRPGVSR